MTSKPVLAGGPVRVRTHTTLVIIVRANGLARDAYGNKRVVFGPNETFLFLFIYLFIYFFLTVCSDECYNTTV